MKLAVAGGFLLVALSSAWAVEKGAAAGTGRSVTATEGSRAAVEDVRGHELALATRADEITTPDRIAGVSFDGAKFRTQIQSDLVNGVGLVRGYGTWEAKSGEKLFVMYGYAVNPVSSSGPFPLEGTFEWIGGTGPLANVRGKGTLEGEVTQQGDVHYRWAGSYERIGK